MGDFPPITNVKSVVDETNVQTIQSDDGIAQEEYTDPSRAHHMFHILDKTRFISSAVVAPKNVADVQEIIKPANEFEISAWPFFKGRNVGYGGAAPRVPGSLGIAMGKNMDRVLKIDTENVYALLEPGVSYLDLHEYLVKHNFRWFTLHWDGRFAEPKADKSKPPHEQEPNESWQLFDYSIDPHSAGIFSQSSLGIVVKMGIWLMPNPGGYQAYMITFPRDKDLDQIVEILRPLRISGVIQNIPKLENVLVSAALQSHRSDSTNSNNPLTDLELDEIVKTLNVGRRNLYGAMYGTLVIRKRSLVRHQSVLHTGFDFIGVFVVGAREMHHIVCILFDRKDPDLRHRAYKLIQVLIAKAASRGWREHRALLALMDQTTESYSFDKNARMQLNEKLKNTLDPKGILCLGKNGVWPANNRKEDWYLHRS
ncbi:hypothetical protein BDV41DRAFT_560370 [Aspergillus transmontanensis]|uniref:FAD linked oxidase N-terminal domain-containing protein n=1 Tax=Aspergillus transmontanensis TaxID=1034304 RepID=A0A5N6WE63_9EURO|nr:hypothetical protein BDV41DRAFT_560370 [Aspergillus transmontanensis]